MFSQGFILKPLPPCRLWRSVRGQGARLFSLLASLFVLISPCLFDEILARESSTEKVGFDPAIFRISYEPVISEATRQRAASTGLGDRWSPLQGSALDGPGFRIQRLDGFISLSQLQKIEQQLRAHDPLRRADGDQIVLAAALAPMMAVQLRASDWFPRLSSERLQFGFETLAHHVYLEEKKERFFGRRHYVLNQITQQLDLPFNLNRFVVQGRFVPALVDQYFDEILKTLETHTENAQQEFRDYLLSVSLKFSDQSFEGPLVIEWNNYKPLREESSFFIELEEGDGSVSSAEQRRWIERWIEYLVGQGLQPIQSFALRDYESFYAYFLVHGGFDLNFNQGANIRLTRMLNNMGESSLPVTRVKASPNEIELSELGIKRLIFKAVNPIYLSEAFRREFVERSMSQSRDFARAYRNHEVTRFHIENEYHDRLQNPSRHAELAETWSFAWRQIEIPIPSDFDENKIATYYREIFEKAERFIRGEMIQLYQQEATAKGFPNLQAAAQEAYKFADSLRELPGLRAESFQQLVNELAERIVFGESLKHQSKRAEGSLEEILEKLTGSLSPQAREIESTLAEFASRELQNQRQFFVVRNFIKISEDGDSLVLWMPESIAVTSFKNLYQDDNALYFAVKRELESRNLHQAYRFGLRDFLRYRLRYFDAKDTPLENRLPSSEEALWANERSLDVFRIIELAAVIEHHRTLEEERWWTNDFLTRYR